MLVYESILSKCPLCGMWKRTTKIAVCMVVIYYFNQQGLRSPNGYLYMCQRPIKWAWQDIKVVYSFRLFLIVVLLFIFAFIFHIAHAYHLNLESWYTLSGIFSTWQLFCGTSLIQATFVCFYFSFYFIL